MGHELKSVWSYMMPVRVSFQSVIDAYGFIFFLLDSGGPP